MNKTILAVALAASLAACSAAPPPTPSAPGTPTSVCADIAAVKVAPDAAAALSSIDQHSALGVVWADVQSGCVGAIPAAGVNASWTAEVWAMAKVLIPQVLPTLVPILIGLL